MNCCSVALHWENQLALMHLTIAGAHLVISACIPLPGKWYEPRRMLRGGGGDWDRWRTKWKTSFWDDDREDRHASRQTQTLSTYWHCLVSVSACSSMCLCVRLCKCELWDNSVWVMCPRSVGTLLGFHRYRSPGTTTDRQADGETVDHKQLSAEVLKPAHSQRATYWSMFPSFSASTDSDPETPTWEDLCLS